MPGYDAFISYSHRADDFRAAALELALEHLGRPFYRRRALDVFRDETSLSANPALWPSIERALSQSRYFVLMASPESGASPWCTKEIEWWLANRSADTFLIVLTAGECAFDEKGSDFDWARTTAVSPTLRGKFPVEPFYRDLRWAQRGDNLTLTNPRFRSEVLPLAAALHGKAPEELDGEDLRQFRRTRRFWRGAAVALSILTIVSGIAAWIAFKQREQARVERQAALVARNEAREQRNVAREQRDVAVQARDAEKAARTAEEKARKAEEEQRRAAEVAEQRAVEQRDIAIRQRNLAVARQLAIKAEFLQKDKPGLLPQSMLVASESLRRAPSLEADRTLRRGMELLPWKSAETQFRPYLTEIGLSAVSGDYLAFLTYPDGEIHVVEASWNGIKELKRWVPGERVRMITFGGPGLGIAMRNGKALLWKFSEPEPKEMAQCEHDDLIAVAVSRKHLVASCDGLRIVDLETGAATQHEIKDVIGLAFSDNAEQLGIARANGSTVLLDVAEWKQKFATEAEYNGAIFANSIVAFSPNGAYLVKATLNDKVLRVLDTATGTVVASLNHPDLVLAIDFDRDGYYVATAGADGIARVFDPRTGGVIAELRHNAAVRDVRLTGDSYGPPMLATASEDGTARIWNTRTGREIARVDGPGPVGYAIPRFASANHITTLSYDGTMRQWSSITDRRDDVAYTSTSALGAAWLPSQQVFGVAMGGFDLHRLDPQNRKRWKTFGDSEVKVKAETAAWSAGGTRVLLAGKERSQVWDMAAGKVIGDYKHGYASAWALSTDGSIFAVVNDKSVLLHRVGRNAPPTVIPLDGTSYGSVLAASGTHLAVGTLAGVVLQRLDSRAAATKINDGKVEQLAFSGDGRFLAWTTYGLRVYDVGAGHAVPLRTELHPERFVFSADGRLIAGGGGGGFAVWSLPDGKQLASGALADGEIASLAFSGDGRFLAIGSKDGLASVHRIADGVEMARVTVTFTDPGKRSVPVVAVALSERGEYLLTSNDISSRIWPIEPNLIVAEACKRLPQALTKAEWTEYVGSEAYRVTCGSPLTAARR